MSAQNEIIQEQTGEGKRSLGKRIGEFFSVTVRDFFKERWVFRGVLKELYEKDRNTLILGGVVLVAAGFLFVFSLFHLQQNVVTVRIGYGDLMGGYRSGQWTDMLCFPILALIYGFLHNLLALRLVKLRGVGAAKVLLWVTLGLIVGTFVILVRLSSLV